ncbi:hypothetical protein HRI_003949200 [Hibiscus trionum]|uniref:PPM-type phosphatase domain-containing protein n=1 Tax=Hibiscus trionum TaxID=183268 RepID=A0A9W7MKA1_HIBTR|nr:hypothetical protein HRI_003949200 [Hibiscus trionum]
MKLGVVEKDNCTRTHQRAKWSWHFSTEEDEFLIMGCDGLWDVMSSECAVTMARKELMLHNDPERCSRELVREALKRNTCDNLTVIVVCFSADPPPRIEILPQSHLRRSISSEGLNLLKGVLDCN